MKTYTYTFPKNNTKNNNADAYKAHLMNRVINAYPWLIDDEDDKRNESIIGMNIIYDDKEAERNFLDAINWLNYAIEHGTYSPDYDFEDIFGTPIKIFHNFIQYGYEIIPIAPGSMNHLKKETKKKILEITIKIKNLRSLY